VRSESVRVSENKMKRGALNEETLTKENENKSINELRNERVKFSFSSLNIGLETNNRTKYKQ
jgi:hypothetical protein